MAGSTASDHPDRAAARCTGSACSPSTRSSCSITTSAVVSSRYESAVLATLELSESIAHRPKSRWSLHLLDSPSSAWMGRAAALPCLCGLCPGRLVLALGNLCTRCRPSAADIHSSK
eukprot:7614382-Heterocapsa_arctica.AAC.1